MFFEIDPNSISPLVTCLEIVLDTGELFQYFISERHLRYIKIMEEGAQTAHVLYLRTFVAYPGEEFVGHNLGPSEQGCSASVEISNANSGPTAYISIRILVSFQRLPSPNQRQETQCKKHSPEQS